jgi:holo-[acyl-carrier protein] synthase
MNEDGVLARAAELIAISEVAELLGRESSPILPFTEAERAYAASKSDPERRLAARLAAKRAASTALGGDVPLEGIEVTPARGGPPGIRFSGDAALRARTLGVRRVLLSLTHGLTHAAAVVLLLGEGR